jgi:putative chitinase
VIREPHTSINFGRVRRDAGARIADASTIAGDVRSIRDQHAAGSGRILAQIGHELGGLQTTQESFNYSITALPQTLTCRRITPAIAAVLGRQAGETMVPIERQKKIANITYASQYGNGDSSSGDEWSFRGSGLMQLTFCGSYKACSDDLNPGLITDPDRVRTDLTIAALVSGWFRDEWFQNACRRSYSTRSRAALTRRRQGRRSETHCMRLRRMQFASQNKKGPRILNKMQRGRPRGSPT